MKMSLQEALALAFKTVGELPKDELRRRMDAVSDSPLARALRECSATFDAILIQASVRVHHHSVTLDKSLTFEKSVKAANEPRFLMAA